MDLIKLNDGSLEIVADMRDFIDLIDRHLGIEARHWLEEAIDEELTNNLYAEELEREIDDLKEYHRSVMKNIRKHGEKLGKLICEKELNRREISNTVGAIGTITWREMNR
ncbi:hypothetical protein [uncultured Dysosmobacter sp.]|uniref:hypothetical protein n=1 Tax=uncultured Dysosmobacter sp. TaxID=2591384 RepID=UPI002634BE9E|nr:hypothetical protein [uncultured Dysosmobacter sp.]